MRVRTSKDDELSFKAARDCINTAMKDAKKGDGTGAVIALHNAMECLKSIDVDQLQNRSG